MNTRKTVSFALALGAAAVSMTGAPVAAQSAKADVKQTSEVVLRSEVEFQPLNPARGDASPQAGVLWGDIKKDVPSGVVLKFGDGFASPPHIHNITYRAVVISGAVHNDDPDAANLWMGPGSFWTQPAGEAHITAATEGGATAFLEILEGPYLVQPTDEAFDNGEHPLNLEESNVVWLDAADVNWVDHPGHGESKESPKMSFLWGSTQPGELSGSFLKLPAGYNGTLTSDAASLRAVVISGAADVQVPSASEASNLVPGSYFGSTGEANHQISCTTEEACVLYVRTDGKYEVSAS